MQLKNSYSAREVAAMTGLSARQLQWWDTHRVFAPAVGPRRTAAGGFTERRYTPIDLLELMVLADLRRQGMPISRIRLLLETLRMQFGVRLFDAVGGAGPLTLLTDGRDIYARTTQGEFFNVLRDPSQPLLVLGSDLPLKTLTARARPHGRRRPARRKKPAQPRPPRDV